MNSYLVKITTGPCSGRSFIIENVTNEAEAINETFKRMEQEPEEWTKMEVLQLPLGGRK